MGTDMRTIDSLLGGTIHIKEKLGEGGQGSVYRVEYQGTEKAMKWYRKSILTDPENFYAHIKGLVMSKSPSKAFLWPLDITKWYEGSFGYIMDLRPSGYYDMTDFLLTHVRFPSYRQVTDAAMSIVSAFRQLHNGGYSYQDINDGNFFINPKNGDVLICDNDNVAPNGEKTGILGKPRYMAPEIVMRRKMPDIYSDRFSLAVILFILFTLNHPLEGKRSLCPVLSSEIQEKLYGSRALFMMDPEDSSNGPEPKVHGNAISVWHYLPDFMKEIFLRAFSQKAIQNPNTRPTEAEWIRALTRFRSCILKCSCGNEVFSIEGRSKVCENCKKTLRIPHRLELLGYALPALPGTRLYKCQTCVCDAAEALKPTARIVASQKDPGSFGIQNVSDTDWTAVSSTGGEKMIESGGYVPVRDGFSFRCNEETIMIKSNQEVQ